MHYRCDSKGNPFEFPTYLLNSSEYAKIISEINTNYGKYKGKPLVVHLSVGYDGCYYVYYFENRGFNDCNIYEKIKL